MLQRRRRRRRRRVALGRGPRDPRRFGDPDSVLHQTARSRIRIRPNRHRQPLSVPELLPGLHPPPGTNRPPRVRIALPRVRIALPGYRSPSTRITDCYPTISQRPSCVAPTHISSSTGDTYLKADAVPHTLPVSFLDPQRGTLAVETFLLSPSDPRSGIQTPSCWSSVTGSTDGPERPSGRQTWDASSR
jgi:hypothetical protein